MKAKDLALLLLQNPELEVLHLDYEAGYGTADVRLVKMIEQPYFDTEDVMRDTGYKTAVDDAYYEFMKNAIAEFEKTDPGVQWEEMAADNAAQAKKLREEGDEETAKIWDTMNGSKEDYVKLMLHAKLIHIESMRRADEAPISVVIFQS